MNDSFRRPGDEGEGLRARSISATAWSGVDLFLRQGLQFGVSIALARLLTPGDFGTVALLAIFLGIASHFVDTGFASAIVQRQNIAPIDVSSVFWFNFGSGCLMTALLWVAAPAIAAFYNVPTLVPLTRVMAFTLFLAGLSSVQQALLIRSMDFKTQAKVGALATGASGITAVFLAWRGAGVWALVAQAVVLQLVTALLLWFSSAWRPLASFKLGSLRSLFEYSGPLFGYFGLGIVYSRLYSVLIGKFYSPKELGYYSRANNTQGLAWGFLLSVVHRVAFPSFSVVADDRARFRRGFKSAQLGVMLLAAPAVLGMFAVAPNLVPALFGPQWYPSIPILQVLCFSGLVEPLHALNGLVLMAHGDSGLLLKTDTIAKLVGVAALLAATPFGLMAMAVATLVYALSGFLVKGHYAGRVLGYPIREQLRDVGPIMFLALAMAVPVWLFGMLVRLTPWPMLAMQVFIGIALYVGVNTAFRHPAVSEAWSAGRQMYSRVWRKRDNDKNGV